MTRAKSDTAKTQTVKSQEKEPVMYVGPTIVGLGIQNQVYSEIPKQTKEILKETPELNNLFISIKEYPDACRMLREKRGYIYSAYNKALTIKNGGK